MTVHRFSGFALDETRHELTFHGRPVRLAPQPFRLLAALAARRGELVTRAELERALWREGTFVDADAGLNFCVRTLRRALAEVAGDEEWIETVPRLGYRLRAAPGPLSVAAAATVPAEPPAPAALPAPFPPPAPTAPRALAGRLLATALLVLFAVAAVAVVTGSRRGEERRPTVAVAVSSDGRPDVTSVARAFEAELVAALVARAGERGAVALGGGAAAARAERRLVASWLEIPAGLRVDLRLSRADEVVLWQESVELSRDRWFHGRSTYAEGVAREVADRVWDAPAPPDPPELAPIIAAIESGAPGAAAGALEPLRAAVAAQPSNARAHAFLAAALVARWDLAGAEASARRALALEPATPEAERVLAGVLSARGRHGEAIAAAERARRLAPLEPRSQFVLARTLLFAGRHQQVVATTDAALALLPEARGLWRWRYLAFLALGDAARAGEALANVLRLSEAGARPDPALARASMADIRSEWRAELAGSRGVTVESPASRAALHALLGERDAALAELERSIAAREESAVFFASAPWFESLRGDARFRDLVRRVAPESAG